MSIKNVAIDIGIVVAVATAAFGAGYVRGFPAGVRSNNTLVLNAQQETANANVKTKAAVDGLDAIKQRLDVQRQTLLAAQQVARAALDQRDITQHKLDEAIAQRIHSNRKAAHESPDCAALEHLPVCPVLARRLFGPPGEANTHAADPHGH